MKAGARQNKKKFLLSLVAALTALILVPAWAYADTYPYFKVVTGGLSAGGGYYADPSTPCKVGDADYQTPDFSSIANLNANAKKGGILAFGNTTGQGAHSDLSAQALGLIEGNSSLTPPLNFYSGNTVAGNSLSFANDLSNSSAAGYSNNYNGGFFSGGSGTAYCIYDYYGKYSNGISVDTSTTTLPATLGPGSYSYNPGGAGNGLLSTGSFSVSSGSDVTVFVKGNLYIGGAITYSGANPQGTDTNGTKLAFVVKGDIFIAPSVTTLNGLYVSQPANIASPDLSSGTIYTCHSNVASPIPDGTYIKNNCETTVLAVNGAFIGQLIVLDRAINDLPNATPAETFTFTPEMVLGGPFFAGSTTTTATVDSLVSLPPVF